MIQRIRVQNFKSILDVTVKLAPVTVLVGRSGSGKTNFVEAIRFLRDLLTSPESRNRLQQQWPGVRPATGSEQPTRFEVDFAIDLSQDPFRYQLAIAPEGPNAPPVEESLHLGQMCFFHQVRHAKTARSEWRVEPELVRPLAAGPIALGKIPSLSEVVIAYTALTSGIGCYAFSDEIFRAAPPNQRGSGLDDRASNYLDVLRDISSNLQDLTVRRNIVGSLQRLNASVSAIELDDIQRPTHVVVGHRTNGKTIALQLSQESAGFRRFYAHLLALYQRPPKQLLVFEHPEDGIHPAALSLLAEEFKAAAESSRGQVLLTTHSPEMLNAFESEQIRVVELADLQTRIGDISSEQQQAISDHLLDAGELLTVDPARLQSSPRETTEA